MHRPTGTLFIRNLPRLSVVLPKEPTFIILTVANSMGALVLESSTIPLTVWVGFSVFSNRSMYMSLLTGKNAPNFAKATLT